MDPGVYICSGAPPQAPITILSQSVLTPPAPYQVFKVFDPKLTFRHINDQDSLSGPSAMWTLWGPWQQRSNMSVSRL